MHGPDVLIDTPEEAKQQLNRSRVTRDRRRSLLALAPGPHRRAARLGVAQLRVPLVAAAGSETTPIYVPSRVWQRLRDVLRARRPVPLHGAPGNGPRRPDRRQRAASSSTAWPSRRSRSTPRTRTRSCSRPTGQRVLVAMDETHGWTPPDLGPLDLAVLPIGVFEHHPYHRRADDPGGVLQAAGQEDALRPDARAAWRRSRRAAPCSPTSRRWTGSRTTSSCGSAPPTAGSPPATGS